MKRYEDMTAEELREYLSTVDLDELPEESVAAITEAVKEVFGEEVLVDTDETESGAESAVTITETELAEVEEGDHSGLLVAIILIGLFLWLVKK